MGTDHERLRELADFWARGWTASPQATELARGVLALLGELVAVREERDAALALAEELEVPYAAAERERDTLREALRGTVAALTIWETAVGEINVWPLQCRNALAAARAALSTVDTPQEET